MNDLNYALSWISLFKHITLSYFSTNSSVQLLSRVRLCNPMDCSTPGLPVHHQLPEFTQTHLHWVSDAIQPSYPLSSPLSPAAAKSLQSCPTLCDSIDRSPPGSPIPGILQARTLEWVAISLSNAWKWTVKVKSISPVRLLATPWTAAYQALPSMVFSRQEYWSGVPLPSPKLKLCPINNNSQCSINNNSQYPLPPDLEPFYLLILQICLW